MSSTVYFSDAADSLVTITNTFTQNGAATDPAAASILLTVTDPTGATTSYTYGGPGTIQRVSAGVYTQTVAATLDGLWQAVWKATASSGVLDLGVEESNFTVYPPGTTTRYCSLAEVKNRIGKTDTQSDFEIITAIQAAERDIEGFCGRYFWRGTATRTYVPEDLWRQPIDDVVSVTSVNLDTTGNGVYDTTWTPGTQYILEVSESDYNNAASGEQRPYTQLRAVSGNWFPFVWPFVHQDRIQIVGVFGWPAVPPIIKQCALLISTDYFKLREAPFGAAGFAEYLTAVKSTAEPMIQDMLRPYVATRRKVGV